MYFKAYQTQLNGEFKMQGENYFLIYNSAQKEKKAENMTLDFFKV